MFSFVAYAKDIEIKKEDRDRFMLQNENREINREKIKEENRIKYQEIKDESVNFKNNLLQNKTNLKNQLEDRIQNVKKNREDFRTELADKKEETKQKMTEMRTHLKEKLLKIKDDKKKLSVEKIIETIQNLNIKLTNNLLEKVDNIENVLISIESRINKAEEKGLDVTKTKAEVEKAKIVIKTAREAVLIQAEKVYEVKITTEENLRVEMKKIRDLFKVDMKTVYEKVKLAHTAVKNTAVSLVQISKIDNTDDVEINNEIKDSLEIEN